MPVTFSSPLLHLHLECCKAIMHRKHLSILPPHRWNTLIPPISIFFMKIEIQNHPQELIFSRLIRTLRLLRKTFIGYFAKPIQLAVQLF